MYTIYCLDKRKKLEVKITQEEWAGYGFVHLKKDHFANQRLGAYQSLKNNRSLCKKKSEFID